MITKTSLRSRRYLARVKKATVTAVNMAPWFKSGVCMMPITNCRGDLSCYAIARVGGSIEYLDSQDNDITGAMLQALRDYHAQALYLAPTDGARGHEI